MDEDTPLPWRFERHSDSMYLVPKDGPPTSAQNLGDANIVMDEMVRVLTAEGHGEPGVT